MLHAKITGNGLPIVFLHGFCEDMSLWNSINESLAGQYKVITIDLPGFGNSTQNADDFSIDDIATEVHNFLLNNLNIEKYVIMGHSLGGYISLAMADLFPDSILALGLINSTSFADTQEKKELRNRTIKFITQNGVKVFLAEFVKNLFTSANQINNPSTIKKVLEMGVTLPEKVVNGYMLAMRERPDRSFILSQHNNILFIGGAQDQHISFQDSKQQGKMLKNAKNGHILKKVAHMSMFEAEKSFEKAIKTFLLSLKMIENG